MAQDAQQVMLAHSWGEDTDPTGYWMSEKLVRRATSHNNKNQQTSAQTHLGERPSNALFLVDQIGWCPCLFRWSKLLLSRRQQIPRSTFLLQALAQGPAPGWRTLARTREIPEMHLYCQEPEG